MYNRLHKFCTRPQPFSELTTRQLWTRPHIAEQMLKYHLDDSTELASRKPQDIDSIVRWIDSRLGLAEKKVCDLGCGPGLHASRFAERGAQVTGLDFSSSSINYARQQAQLNGWSIDYQANDYLVDSLPRGFDIITLIYFDYCAVSPDLRSTLLEKVSGSLGVGGRFVLDVLGRGAFASKKESTLLEQNLMNGFWSDTDYVGLQRTFLYPESQLSLDRYLIVEESDCWEVYNWLQHFTSEEITRELDQAGFDVEYMAGSLAGDSLQPGGESIGVIARKR